MSHSPIILFIYNRPSHTQLTLEALSKNTLAQESDLIIFADGPKEKATLEQIEKIEKAREVAKSKQWCKTVEIWEAEKNKGLAASIIDGVTEIVNKFGRVIVLEDDLITSPYFLQYMNDALNIYEKTDKVACISGFMYPHKKNLPETFFIKGADCWGWATWDRAWKHFNTDSQFLLDEINKRNLSKHFNFNNTYDYTGMLQQQIDGKISSWAIRWLASSYLDDMYCLYPSKSLVINIGLDGSGTHCLSENRFTTTRLNQQPISVIWQNPAECKKALNTIYHTLKKNVFIIDVLLYIIRLIFKNIYNVYKQVFIQKK